MHSSNVTFFALFGLGAICYYILLFRMYRYVKSLGRVSTPPLSPNEVFSFVGFCFDLQKDLKDSKLKFYVFSTNGAVAFCVLVILVRAFN